MRYISSTCSTFLVTATDHFLISSFLITLEVFKVHDHHKNKQYHLLVDSVNSNGFILTANAIRLR